MVERHVGISGQANLDLVTRVRVKTVSAQPFSEETRADAARTKAALVVVENITGKEAKTKENVNENGE